MVEGAVTALLEDLVRDVRHGVRALRRAPVFAAARFSRWRSGSERTRRSSPSSTACCCGRSRTRGPHS